MDRVAETVAQWGWPYTIRRIDRTWGVGVVQFGLDLLLPAMFPANLDVADACMLVTIIRWPDGWPHGTDGLWQACDDVPQRAQAAGLGSDHILVDGLAAEAQRSGV